MAKRLFLLHLGPRPVDTGSMAEALAVGGVEVPDVDADRLAHAEVEILRSHKAAGLRRKDVEGAWARVCRRARKSGTDSFVSMPKWSAATPAQAALALHGLADFRVVLVATSGFTEPRGAGCRRCPTSERTSCPPTSATSSSPRRSRGSPSWRRRRVSTGASPRWRGDAGCSTGGRPPDRPGGHPQCGCQASSSSVRAATSDGSVPSASCWMVTCSKTLRNECRAAIHTCCSTCALSSYSTDSGRRP